MDDYFKMIGESFREADRARNEMREQFDKLLAEPCMTPARANDIVIVAAGLLGKGHPWARTECTVIAVGDTSVKVQFTGDWIRPEAVMWIHPALITDNLGPRDALPTNTPA